LVRRQRVEELAVLHTSCCGIDVHQKSIAACVLTVDRAGKLASEVRQFGTTTRELLALADWLAHCRVTHVAMESTGVYWKPIFNILEGHFEVVLANAALWCAKTPYGAQWLFQSPLRRMLDSETWLSYFCGTMRRWVYGHFPGARITGQGTGSRSDPGSDVDARQPEDRADV
jgi:Transposase